MDNNFNNMPKVVGEGRRVINNIKNSSSLYLMKTLFTAILAVICMSMQVPYLFMPQNMLLLEVCIIGIPSFFLSLQPNTDRVQGKFISYVMSGAASGAVLMILCVMSMYITTLIDPFEYGEHYVAMCMLALTFSGLVMVYRVCRPLNVYRSVLCVSMLAMCITAVSIPILTDTLLFSGWKDITWDTAKILIIVVVIEAAFPLSGWLIDLMHFILPSSGKQRKEKEKVQENNSES